MKPRKLKITEPDTLALPLDYVTQTGAILAVRGAGKSNAAAAIAEEMHAAGLPWVVIDPVGSWWGVRAAANGKAAGLSVPIFGGRHGDVPLERNHGALLADLVVDERLTCVLDVSEFSEGDKIRFLIDFGERLYRRNSEPLHLFLEEADDYVPQKPFREQTRLLRVWENIVRRGRARGLGITMITQRSASLNKSVLTQIETLFVLRTTSPQDRKAIEAWVHYQGGSTEMILTLPKLASGEGWVWSPAWLQRFERVRFRRRWTFDSGSTPKHARSGRPVATLADIDLGAIRERMAETIERAKETDPRELQAKIAQQRKEIEALKATAAPPAPDLGPIRATLDEIEAQREALLLPLRRVREQLAAFLTPPRGGRVDLGPARPVKRSNSASSIPTPPGVVTMRATVARATNIERMRTPPPNASDAGGKLPRGELAVLKVAAMYPNGATRGQITQIAGYKKTSRDEYIRRLVAKGFLHVTGDRVVATDEGTSALGADHEQLPSGAELLAYQLARLPVGERAVLEAVVSAHPEPATRELISEATGYKKTSRDEYIRRLAARMLVIVQRDGAVSASPELFDQ